MTLKEFITADEGRKLTPYKCPAGAWTIGVGHNMDAKPLPADIAAHLHKHGAITNEMADKLLEADIREATADARVLYKNFDTMSQVRQSALVNFLFQLGFHKARGFKKANKAINTEDWPTAAKEMLDSKWARQTPQRAQRIATIIEGGKLTCYKK